MMRLTIITAIAIIISFAPVSATILHVPSQYSTIQAGINASMNGDTVLVQPGTYHENALIDQHHITLGSLFLTTGDTSYISTTVIDGDSLNSVVRFNNWLDSLSVLIGFSLTHGGGMYGGGGIRIEGSPTICNNIIENNSATRGGGIYSVGSPLIIDNIIRNNHVTVAGGGIISYGGALTVERNIITNNSSDVYGGGIHIEDSETPVICNNMIRGNSGTYIGGGILFYADNLGGIVYGNVITNNTSEMFASIGFYDGDYRIVNNTICDNSYAQYGLVFSEYCDAILVNNIIWNNANIEILVDSMADVSVTYSDVQGGFEGEGNINSAPIFRDSENGNYRLMAIECDGAFNSPCIDAGDPEILDNLLDCSHGLGDLRSDIGAYGGLDSAGISIEEPKSPVPTGLILSQNYPNPFNARTTIEFTLPKESAVNLMVYDIQGRRVASLVGGVLMPAVHHKVSWDARAIPSGIYLLKLSAGDFAETRKIALLK